MNTKYYIDKENIKNDIDCLLAMVSDNYNIYLHHIWGIKDNEENIKNFIMNYGVEVKYRNSMMSTCYLIKNPDANKILDYYFSYQNKNRFVVAIAIPKTVTLSNGVELPFSNGKEPITPYGGNKLNQTYVSVYDICKGTHVANEFVLFSVKTDVKDCFYELEINDNHIANSLNENETLSPYIEKAEKLFEIDSFDNADTICQKIDNKLDVFNSENVIFHENYVQDFDFD